ncbi:cupin domain-containing protein [Pseudomaricurvus alkylphenolicus]|uniref:cupin domain-containing protein n=1 Tax=Pseudomaricurvus alkylphenolicus TaxID=1306991 RepID=UPI00197D1C79|nr:cupin domain-containing protein [Pseudomaricurvus alkylphenolicus]
MDFSQTLTINTAEQPWQASPREGVWRKPLAREEQERGHATSVVRYDPGASFHSHNHPGGEEILVLEGTFSDETGDFGKGTYFRNPAGFVHAPFSREGCLILVKLHQFQEEDSARISIDLNSSEWLVEAEGIQRLRLHRAASESVEMLRLEEGTQLDLSDICSVEWYLLDGRLEAAGQSHLEAGTWHRSPRGTVLWVSKPATLWLKSGHF